MQQKINQVLKKQDGAFSIEMLLVIGVIVILVVVAMSMFSRESTEMSNQYDKNVSSAIQQQSLLNSLLIKQQKTSF